MKEFDEHGLPIQVDPDAEPSVTQTPAPSLTVEQGQQLEAPPDPFAGYSYEDRLRALDAYHMQRGLAEHRRAQAEAQQSQVPQIPDELVPGDEYTNEIAKKVAGVVEQRVAALVEQRLRAVDGKIAQAGAPSALNQIVEGLDPAAAAILKTDLRGESPEYITAIASNEKAVGYLRDAAIHRAGTAARTPSERPAGTGSGGAQTSDDIKMVKDMYAGHKVFLTDAQAAEILRQEEAKAMQGVTF